MELAEAVARLYSLKVDTTTKDGDGAPHEKPHKPLFLLAALDLIDEDLASPNRIPTSIRVQITCNGGGLFHTPIHGS